MKTNNLLELIDLQHTNNLTSAYNNLFELVQKRKLLNYLVRIGVDKNYAEKIFLLTDSTPIEIVRTLQSDGSIDNFTEESRTELYGILNMSFNDFVEYLNQELTPFRSSQIQP